MCGCARVFVQTIRCDQGEMNNKSTNRTRSRVLFNNSRTLMQLVSEMPELVNVVDM